MRRKECGRADEAFSKVTDKHQRASIVQLVTSIAD